ncbi:hypothetical protein NEOC65_002119 [Neochlamydia sp. AcF65]|nr:hypothetical protein [Neochlamydia sp. AcF65]
MYIPNFIALSRLSGAVLSLLDSYKEAEQASLVGEILSNTLIKLGLHT